MNFTQIAGILAAVSAMTNILAQLVHSVGNVNHPVILDKVNATLAEASGIVTQLAQPPQTTTPPNP